MTESGAGVPHALFVNSGILGQRTFACFVERAFVSRTDLVRATQIVIADGLSPAERVFRRAVCQRWWRDGRLRNLDFFRFRAEWHGGVVARRRIRRLVRSGARFDVLHFHHQATAYASIDYMRTIPSIVSIDCTQGLVVDSARTRLEAWTYGPNVRRDGEIFRAARLIVSPSEWAARSVRDEYPGCHAEILVLPTPVELASFDSAWIEERYARATQSAAYCPRVLFVGGDFARKGGYDLLHVWRSGRFGDRARLDVVTSAAIDATHLSDGVTVHLGVAAHTPPWVDLWRGADLFVLPTRDEALGMVFQEAAAAGLPRIGTRINAIPELVDEFSGTLIRPGDREALACALDRLIASADLRRDLGAHARRRIAGRADADTYRDHLAAVIRRLATSSARLHAHTAA